MRIETSRKIIPQVIFVRVSKLTFSLYNHKRESDRAKKHQEWTPQKHIVLTTLAILTDVGFNSTVAMLAFSGNYVAAAFFKSIHIIGAETVPQALTDLKNQIITNNHN